MPAHMYVVAYSMLTVNAILCVCILCSSFGMCVCVSALHAALYVNGLVINVHMFVHGR